MREEEKKERKVGEKEEVFEKINNTFPSPALWKPASVM